MFLSTSFVYKYYVATLCMAPHQVMLDSRNLNPQDPPSLGSKGKHRFLQSHGVRAGLEGGIGAGGPQNRELGPAWGFKEDFLEEGAMTLGVEG